MSEFLQFWWQNILKSWQIGYGIFAVVEVVSIIGAAALRWRGKHRRDQWEDVTMKVAIGLLAISFLVSTFLVAPFLQYKDIAEKTKSRDDLRVSVITYYYRSATQELVSEVQFENNGPRRRTILGALFTYRYPNSKDTLLVMDPTQEDFHSHESRVYAEPGQPIVIRYAHRLYDSEAIATPGVIFGLQLTTILPDGGMNYTSVSAMAVVAISDGTIKGLLTTPQKNISLDIIGGFNPISVQFTPPSSTSTPQPSATPKTEDG